MKHKPAKQIKHLNKYLLLIIPNDMPLIITPPNSTKFLYFQEINNYAKVL